MATGHTAYLVSYKDDHASFLPEDHRHGSGRLAAPFRELEERPDHWLVALNAITGVDPAPVGSNFEEAVNAWLDWGRRQGYLT